MARPQGRHCSYWVAVPGWDRENVHRHFWLMANAKCSIRHREGAQARAVTGAQVTCDNLLRHGNLIIYLAWRCICYHSVPRICDELNDMFPSGRHLPEWVMNNHLEPSFVPLLVWAVPWLSVGVFAVGKKHSAWTWISEAASMTTSSDHPSASLVEDRYFTILPCLNAETLQWAGIFNFICCYYSSDKRQSDLQPFQSLMPCHAMPWGQWDQNLEHSSCLQELLLLAYSRASE